MEIKKFFKMISNNNFDQTYNRALNSGALGGKLLGAGGEVFLFIVKKNKQKYSKIK